MRMVLSNVRKKKRKRKREPPNVTKVQSHVMLVLHNVRMVPSNVRKKIKEPPNVTEVQSHVMLVLHNVRVVPSNVRKNKRTAEYNKSTIIFDVSTTQCEDGIIKYETKKIKEPSNVTKV